MSGAGDPVWLRPWVGDEVDPPKKNLRGDRSPAELRAVIDQFEVATCERYRKRDLDGNGTLDTTCNIFVHDVTKALGCEIPRMRANAMFDWLLKGLASGRRWSQVQQWVAVALANAGYPVVAAWENPGGAGHIAVVVPSRSELDREHTFIAQSGAVCFGYGRLEQGFGTKSPAALFFAHP